MVCAGAFLTMSEHHNNEGRKGVSEQNLRTNTFFTGLNTILGLLVVAGICWMGSEIIALKTNVATFTVELQQSAASDTRLQLEIDREQVQLDDHSKRIQGLELRANVRTP